MSDGYSSGYRSSANMQAVSPDRIRRNWLETTAFAPVDYRAAHGLSTDIAPAAQQAAFTALSDETPYTDPQRDPYNLGRPVQLPSYAEGIEPLAFLGQASPPSATFADQSQLALLAQDVGAALSGQPARSDDRAGDVLASLFGPQQRVLGGGY